MKKLFRKFLSTVSVHKMAATILFAGLLLMGFPDRTLEARPAPLLDKVFVYAGDENVRLVVLFNTPLDGSDPVPRLNNGTLSLFVQGARGGKPIRQFALEQGGYDRLEAREGNNGLWLTIWTKKGTPPLKGIPNITLGESALTVTLPSLKISEVTGSAPREPSDTPFRKASSSFPPFSGLKSRPVKTSSQVTPDSILEGALSSPSASSVSGFQSPVPPSPVKAEKSPPLTLFRKKRQSSALFGPSKDTARETPRIGSNVMSLSSIALKFAGALGGILTLIVGAFFFFKKLAPAAVSRLGGNGSLVRTIYKTHLAPKKSLALVEVAGEVLVLGISGQNITMLTKIENEKALARVREAGGSKFVEQLTQMISAHSKGAKKTDDTEFPLLTDGKDPDFAIQGDDAQAGVQEKGAAALLAYARQEVPKVNGASGSQGGQDREEKIEVSPIRSADRLRQRLNRMTPQVRGRRASS